MNKYLIFSIKLVLAYFALYILFQMPLNSKITLEIKEQKYDFYLLPENWGPFFQNLLIFFIVTTLLIIPSLWWGWGILNPSLRKNES